MLKKIAVTTLLLIAINVNGQTWNTSSSNLYADPTSTDVGIGTTYPATKLHINANSGQDGLRLHLML
ncbi:MAG: hypothetical protein ACOCUL_04995 [Bacteroidota bacterium]